MLGEGGGSAHSSLENFKVITNYFGSLQILVAAYKFWTSLKNIMGGDGEAPQPCCLKSIWFLTNFSGHDKFLGAYKFLTYLKICIFNLSQGLNCRPHAP